MSGLLWAFRQQQARREMGSLHRVQKMGTWSLHRRRYFLCLSQLRLWCWHVRLRDRWYYCIDKSLNASIQVTSVYCGMPKVRKPAHVFRAHRYLCYFLFFISMTHWTPRGGSLVHDMGSREPPWWLSVNVLLQDINRRIYRPSVSCRWTNSVAGQPLLFKIYVDCNIGNIDLNAKIVPSVPSLPYLVFDWRPVISNKRRTRQNPVFLTRWTYSGCVAPSGAMVHAHDMTICLPTIHRCACATL